MVRAKDNKKIENMLSIHMTDLCNSKCNFCIVDSPSAKTDQVSRERIDKFLEENQNKGFVAVNLHGGEATIRKDFFEILQKINDCNYPRIILQTNAVRIAREQYAKKVCDMGVDLFVVSIHGSTDEVMDHITKTPRSLTKAIRGIKNVKKLGAKVRTNTVISKENYHQLEDMMELLMSVDVDHINLSAVHTAGMAFKNFQEVTPTFVEIEDVVKRSVEMVSANGTKITLEGFPFCTIPNMQQHVIDWSTQRFKMLYRKWVFADYEEFMDSNSRVKGKICQDCKFKNKCGGVYKEYIQIRGWDEIENYKKNLDKVPAMA